MKKPSHRSCRYLSNLNGTLSPNQVGTMLGITGEAVKQWIYTRKLSAVRMANGYWRISRSDLQQFLDFRDRVALPRVLLLVRDKVWETVQAAAMQEHYCTLRANSYADAILKTSSWKPSILIVDIDNNADDGWRVLRHAVRADHYLVITSQTQNDETILKLVECGASATLDPTSSADEFAAQCRSLWKGRAH